VSVGDELLEEFLRSIPDDTNTCDRVLGRLFPPLIQTRPSGDLTLLIGDLVLLIDDLT
jgi:hypothetical protein